MTAVLDLLAAREPTLGAGRLLCIDGPAGSGKTTLAGQVAERTGAPVLRMDDLYDGWRGLPTVGPHVLGILEPLAAGAPGRYRRYDWHAGAYAEEHVVAPAPLLVLEGVGSGSLAWSSWATALVWVEADAEVRLARGLARDGEEYRDEWRQWSEDEQVLFARERTRERADLVLRT
ncbi:MAG: (d)CMP kinase [Nocardioidaceae bacterium]|nr:(d)CMP kinase [Nocardioidaceae bacterium]